ncbi:MAG TPA: hexose kinase [Actinopolymorphaceae bacterium]
MGTEPGPVESGHAGAGRVMPGPLVVTLTPNPSLDRTFAVDDLRRGEVLRALSTSLVPSGKGVNVSRVVAANGRTTVAVLPIGGHDGDHLVDALTADGIALRIVRIRGRIRSNVTVLEPDGTATKLNEPGPDIDADEAGRLIDAALASAGGAGWLVGSGSLPPGAPDGFYADLVRRVSRLDDIRPEVAIDVTGEELLAAAAAGADLVKPNTTELAEVGGTSLRTIGDVVRAAQELRRRGAGSVLASMGADGAVLVSGAGTWFAQVGARRFVSAVGAGDTLLAGFLLGGAVSDPAAGLAVAVALAARRCEIDATMQPHIVDAPRTQATMLTTDIAARSLDEPAA